VVIGAPCAVAAVNEYPARWSPTQASMTSMMRTINHSTPESRPYANERGFMIDF
jgi:hypothetical protein